MNKWVWALSLASVALFGCGQGKSSSDSSTAASKALLSSWAVQPSAAFNARLDLGNHANTPFTLAFKMSDTTECDCANSRLNGDERSGTYFVPACTCGNPGMANSFVGVFETNGTGSYSNTNGTLSLCKANGSCQTYK